MSLKNSTNGNNPSVASYGRRLSSVQKKRQKIWGELEKLEPKPKFDSLEEYLR